MQNQTNNPPHTGLARRQVLKAGAWSVPVVAAAVAVPLAAASAAPRALSMLKNMVASDSPVLLSTEDWSDLVYTVANWEAPVTVGVVFLQITGVADLELDYDPTATTFDAVWSAGPYTQAVENNAWSLSVDGDVATFTTMLTLEPGFSGGPPNLSMIGLRVRQRPGAAPGSRIMSSLVWDSVTDPDPASVVPLAVLFS